MARMGRPGALLLALLVLAPALAALPPLASGAVTPALTYRAVHDVALDIDNDTLYERLDVELTLDVTVAGTYTVVCRLTYLSGGTNRTIATEYTDALMQQGNNTVELSFDSSPIYSSTHSGSFQLNIQATKIDWVEQWIVSTPTKFYDYRDFEAPDNPPPVPPDAPRIELDLHYVNVTTTVFQVFVNRTSPEVLYRYREPRPGLPDFVVRFSRILLFVDDGDGCYDGEDTVASAELGAFPWALTNIKVSGPQVTFDLRARLPVQVGTSFHAVNVSFNFMVTNGSGMAPDGRGFIRGHAAELKVGVLMELADAVPGATAVALEAKFQDTLRNHDFLVEAPTGFKLFVASDSTAYLQVPDIPGRGASVIGMVDSNIVEHAFFGWLTVAEERLASDPDEAAEVQVGASMRVNQDRLEVLLTYPYGTGVASVFHDPSVGVLPANLPPLPPTPPAPEEEQPNIYVWLFAVIVGAAILVLSVYARARGY
jgi:hypothetical protein